MNRKSLLTFGLAAAVLTALSFVGARAFSAAPDKYTLKVPGGLAFAVDFEDWIAKAGAVPRLHQGQNGKLMAAILGNPDDHRSLPGRHPRQRQAFPDGFEEMANPSTGRPCKGNENAPGPADGARASSYQTSIFMVKASIQRRRFPEGGGWNYAAFGHRRRISIPSRPPPPLRTRRRGTTPSAAPPATRRRRRGTSSSPNTRSADHPAWRLLLRLDEGVALQLAERGLQLFLRVHDDRPLPGDRLADRLARHQQEAHGLALAGR